MSKATGIESLNSRLVFIGENIMSDTQTDGYDSVIQSDNQSEDTLVYSGNCIENGEVFAVVEKMPEFPDGHTAMFQYISDHLQYPQEIKDAGITGRVICQFVINTDGSICDVKIVRSTGNELLDNEAVRMIMNMPKWTPGKQNGKPVRVKYSLPINFR